MAINNNNKLKYSILSYHLTKFITNGNYALSYHKIKIVNHYYKNTIYFGKNLTKH